MERLYKLTHNELKLLAAHLADTNHLDLFDPFTDQQLRDYIVNKALYAIISDVID